MTSHLYPNRRTALSLAIAIALGLPAVGYAQATPPAPPAEEELEEVVVTGIRAGIENAIELKAAEIVGNPVLNAPKIKTKTK